MALKSCPECMAILGSHGNSEPKRMTAPAEESVFFFASEMILGALSFFRSSHVCQVVSSLDLHSQIHIYIL